MCNVKGNHCVANSQKMITQHLSANHFEFICNSVFVHCRHFYRACLKQQWAVVFSGTTQVGQLYRTLPAKHRTARRVSNQLASQHSGTFIMLTAWTFFSGGREDLTRAKRKVNIKLGKQKRNSKRMLILLCVCWIRQVTLC